MTDPKIGTQREEEKRQIVSEEREKIFQIINNTSNIIERSKKLDEYFRNVASTSFQKRLPSYYIMELIPCLKDSGYSLFELAKILIESDKHDLVYLHLHLGVFQLTKEQETEILGMVIDKELSNVRGWMDPRYDFLDFYHFLRLFFSETNGDLVDLLNKETAERLVLCFCSTDLLDKKPNSKTIREKSPEHRIFKCLSFLCKKFKISPLNESYELFGFELTCSMFKVVENLERGERVEWVEKYLTSEDASLVGVARLERSIARFTQRVFGIGLSDEDLEELIANENLAAVFRKIIRYDYNTHGVSSSEHFKKQVRIILEARKRRAEAGEDLSIERGKLADIFPRIILHPKNQIIPKKEDTVVSEKFAKIYKEVRSAFYKMPDVSPGGSDYLFAKVKSIYGKILLHLKITHEYLLHKDTMSELNDSEKKVLAKLHRILSLKLKSVNDLKKMTLEILNLGLGNVTNDGTWEYIKTYLRVVIVTIIAARRGGLRVPRFLESGLPQADNLAAIVEFIDQQIIEENFLFSRPGKSDVGVKKIIGDLFELSAFKKELEKMIGKAGKENIPTEIIPDDDLLLEFSSDSQDACWRDKYPEGIQKLYPNIMSYTFVKNPNTKDIDNAGGFLTIDTVDMKTGRPTMVIRAFNPTQAFLAGKIIDPKTGEEKTTKGVNVESLFKQTVAYLKTIAALRGMSLAVVIDHSSGASTNRQPVFNVLDNLVKTKKIKKIEIPNLDPNQQSFSMDLTRLPNINYDREGFEDDSNEEARRKIAEWREKFPTNFNGYDISNCTYSLDDFDTSE